MSFLLLAIKDTSGDYGKHREIVRGLVSGHLGNAKVYQRSKNRDASEPRVANFSLQVCHCMGERVELWRELFGHQGANRVRGAYDESQKFLKLVLLAQSWLHGM